MVTKAAAIRRRSFVICKRLEKPEKMAFLYINKVYKKIAAMIQAAAA